MGYEPLTELDVEAIALGIAAVLSPKLAEKLDDRPLFSPKSLALYLGMSERTVRDMLAAEPGEEPEIKSFLVGDRNRRIAPAEVDRYLASRQDQSTEGE